MSINPPSGVFVWALLVVWFFHPVTVVENTGMWKGSFHRQVISSFSPPPPPPVHLCFQKGGYSPQDGRTSPAVNRRQPVPAPDRRTPGHPPGPGWPGNCSPAHGRPPARSVTGSTGTSHPAPAKNDHPWRCGGLLAKVWEYGYHRGMGPRRLGPCTGPSPHGRIPVCILQPPNYNGGEIWGCKEGNSGPSGAISSVRGPIFPWLDVPASTSCSGPSRWTYSSGTSLADGWNTHGCPGNGTRGDRSPPPGPAPCFPPGGRHAEPHNHIGASGGDWAGWAAYRCEAGERVPPFPRRVAPEQRASNEEAQPPPRSLGLWQRERWWRAPFP